ncbi:MAG TPA: ABC transporter permease [Candidatus Sumerlaeota bacterium]|nr:MAG: Lipoprotein-releasing system transmembrane protein LolC [candidate division BRC1 bacterium ADurb.BinA292]HOE95598.1 ABC transporter permease [Candidatus Sumerlaeota bacterium]HOR28753.1 ABC transporter permease [Candidatus Sumerlaeota bacterium]
MKSLEWFIAWRYLVSRERKALVSLITFISMTGVAVGVAALITVIGVMDGADELLFGKVAELYPHLRVVNLEGPREEFDPEVIRKLKALPGVTHVQPVMQKQAFIIAGQGRDQNRQSFVQLLGMDRLDQNTIYSIMTYEHGDSVTLGEDEILLGLPLAVNIGAMINDRVTLVSTAPVRTAIGPQMRFLKFTMKDGFRTDFYEFDANTAFISTEMMRKLFPTEPGYDYLHVKLKDPFQADRLAARLHLPGYRISTWSQENGAFFSALKLEKLALFVILLLIIFVAALNIIGTLILMVNDKTREIGILKAIGASRRTIWKIFLLDGVMIGILGTGAGVAIGLLLCFSIPYIPLDLPASVYNFSRLPVEVQPVTVLLIVCSSMVICTLAALFPAIQAARLHPVEALRYE